MSVISTRTQNLVDAIHDYGAAIKDYRDDFVFKTEGTLAVNESDTFIFSDFMSNRASDYFTNHPIVTILVKDPEQSTGENAVYVDGGAVILYSVTSTGLVIKNEHTIALDYILTASFNRR